QAPINISSRSELTALLHSFESQVWPSRTQQFPPPSSPLKISIVTSSDSRSCSHPTVFL
ncbi:hypothetical protein BgiBS90_014706, partial [Biomphalaria glabrata]